MISALRYEWRRFATITSSWVMAALAIVVIAGFATLIAWLTEGAGGEMVPGPGVLGATVANPIFIPLGAVFLSVIGAQSLGQEYRHGIIRLTLTEFPVRSRIMAAKVLVVMVAGAAIAAIALALGTVLVLAVTGYPVDGKTWVMLAKGLLFLLLFLLIAFAITGITRNLPLGIIIPIVMALILENIIGAIAFITDKQWLSEWLPFTRALGDLSPDSGWAGFAVMAAWTVGLVAIAWVLFERRDA